MASSSIEMDLGMYSNFEGQSREGISAAGDPQLDRILSLGRRERDLPNFGTVLSGAALFNTQKDARPDCFTLQKTSQ
jgi:hypothetical protein